MDVVGRTGKYLIMMPLVQNVPQGKPGWTKVTCPECGRACWYRKELHEEAKQILGENVESVCTLCALKAGQGV